MKNIFDDGELDKNSVTEKISATAAERKKYPTQFYNLDAIISVGYSVNSCRATSFRIMYKEANSKKWRQETFLVTR